MTRDNQDSRLQGAVLSVLEGGKSVKVKVLRKIVLLSLQIGDDDKHSKKRFKRSVKLLEDEGRLTLNADGLVTLLSSPASKKSKKKRKIKKSAKETNEEETSDSVDHDDVGRDAKRAKTRRDCDGGLGGDETSEQEEEGGESEPALVPNNGNKNTPCAGNPQGITRLFLGNLPFAVDEEALQQFVPGMTHVKWITDKETGRFYGSAFVEMDSSESAADAVKNRAGTKLMNRPIKINYAPARQGDVWPPISSSSNARGGQAGGSGIKAMSAKPDNCKKLFIGNLSYDIDDDGIRKFFASVDAEIKTVRWLHHKDTGDFKGVGFVEFWNEEACEKAAALNGKNLLGRPIRIDWTD